MAWSIGRKLPPPLLYAAALLAAWGLARVTPVAALPRAAWPAAAALVALGLALDVWALWRLRRARTTFLPWERPSALVTDGPFRLSRNPIYVGYTLEYVGLALAMGTAWAWVLLPLVLAVMDRVLIPREERNLREAFGAEYEAYCRRVRKWI